MNKILSNRAASISELKKNPMGVIKLSYGDVVAILNRNVPVFYVVPAKTYELICDALDDLNIQKIVEEIKNQPEEVVKL